MRFSQDIRKWAFLFPPIKRFGRGRLPPCRKNQKVLCEKTHRGRINRGTTSVSRILTEYGLIRHGRTSRLMPPHCNVCTRRSLRSRFGALLPECISCALPYRLAPSGGSLKGTAHYFFPITAFLFSEYHNFFRLSSTRGRIL